MQLHETIFLLFQWFQSICYINIPFFANPQPNWRNAYKDIHKNIKGSFFECSQTALCFMNMSISMCNFQEKNISSLSIRGNALTLETAHGNLLILCQMVLLPNINFLINKQNKKSKMDPKCWGSRLVLLFLDMSCLLHKQHLTFPSGWLVKFYIFYPHLSFETVFPVLKLTQTCCINMYISFLENWQFNHKLAPPLLHTYQAWKTVPTI